MDPSVSVRDRDGKATIRIKWAFGLATWFRSGDDFSSELQLDINAVKFITSAHGAERKCLRGMLLEALEGIPENMCSSGAFLSDCLAAGRIKASACAPVGTFRLPNLRVAAEATKANAPGHRMLG